MEQTVEGDDKKKLEIKNKEQEENINKKENKEECNLLFDKMINIFINSK